MTRELHLELLVGRTVRDAAGEKLGRIEEVRAEQGADGYYVREYMVGPAALLERLSAWALTLGALRFLRKPGRFPFYRVPWDELDLADPEHPRTRRERGALQRLDLAEARGLDDAHQAPHGEAKKGRSKGGAKSEDEQEQRKQEQRKQQHGDQHGGAAQRG